MMDTTPIPTVFDAKNPVASVIYALSWFAHTHRGELPNRVIVPASKETIAADLPKVVIIAIPGSTPSFKAMASDQGIPLCLQEVKESPGVICI